MLVAATICHILTFLLFFFTLILVFLIVKEHGLVCSLLGHSLEKLMLLVLLVSILVRAGLVSEHLLVPVIVGALAAS